MKSYNRRPLAAFDAVEAASKLLSEAEERKSLQEGRKPLRRTAKAVRNARAELARAEEWQRRCRS